MARRGMNIGGVLQYTSMISFLIWIGCVLAGMDGYIHVLVVIAIISMAVRIIL